MGELRRRGVLEAVQAGRGVRGKNSPAIGKFSFCWFDIRKRIEEGRREGEGRGGERERGREGEGDRGGREGAYMAGGVAVRNRGVPPSNTKSNKLE